MSSTTSRAAPGRDRVATSGGDRELLGRRYRQQDAGRHHYLLEPGGGKDVRIYAGRSGGEADRAHRAIGSNGRRGGGLTPSPPRRDRRPLRDHPSRQGWHAHRDLAYGLPDPRLGGNNRRRLENRPDITGRRAADEALRQQQAAIRELSTPVLRIRERLLILPMIGEIDSARARQLASIRNN
ncbi:MAG: hypothetical protein DMD96_02925 [Candidatus Rokuibacteriota bacterium]|nr:MAG: hypothetical protein DMD96_02925 [Candidatus Rokubacteria bacterium]